MPTEFSVIIRGRQGFGNERGYLESIEADVPFVGPTKDYRFDCPGVEASQESVLMFQSRDVDNSKNILTVNGHAVAGGIPVSPGKDTWNGNIMLVASGVLKPRGNELHIEARNLSGGGGGDIDDFIIDNVVVLYKTR